MSSLSTSCCKAALTREVEISSPSSFSVDCEKNSLTKKVPKWVWMYLLLITRETVEISMPTFSAISFSRIGFNLAISPSRK